MRTGGIIAGRWNGEVWLWNLNGPGGPGRELGRGNSEVMAIAITKQGSVISTERDGAYAGISGSGNYQLSILAIGASSGGKCVQNKPPVAFHQVINASGPVSLP